jgi:hypothetical protein
MLFDFTNATESQPKSEVLPKGVYDVEITGAEDTLSKSGNSMIKLEFTVITGPHAGRKIWENCVYRVVEGNPKAAEIGAGRIKSMLKCAGLPLAFKEPQDILGSYVTVSTKVDEREWNGVQKQEAKVSFFKPYVKAEVVPF